MTEVNDVGNAIAAASIDLAQRESERDKAIGDLRRLSDSLERMVSDRTHELVDEMARRERAEETLRQAQKMDAIGKLTGGIAHDFNNMLAIVLGNLDLARRRLSKGVTDIERYLAGAQEGGKRAAALTQRLLAFSRQQPLVPEAVDPNKLVSGMSEMLRRTLGEAIRIETVLAGGLWRIHADPNELENALLNLAVNARDAMPEGGKLTIETANAHLDDRYVTGHPEVSAGQYVMLAVTDTGAGMTGEVSEKAFDPFFTTKKSGVGTGLGLSQVYGFVKQSGGHVKIYTEVDEGTTIKVYLPRHFGPAEPAQPVPDRAALPTGDGSVSILVVEDEEAVRRYSTDALRDLGYRVLEADGAKQALDIIDAEPDIAILFTDVVMPDVNGRRLAEAALELPSHAEGAVHHRLYPQCDRAQRHARSRRGAAVEAVHARRAGAQDRGADRQAVLGSRADRIGLHQNVNRNAEQGAQRANHRQGQRPLARQHLGDAAAAADCRFEIAPAQSLLLDHEFDRGDRIGRGDWKVLRLISLNQCDEHIHAVAVASARLGLPQPLDLLECGAIVGLGFDGADVHAIALKPSRRLGANLGAPRAALRQMSPRDLCGQLRAGIPAANEIDPPGLKCQHY